MTTSTFLVSLAYAENEQIYFVEFSVAEGATVADAIAASQVTSYFPHIDFSALSVGIFNQLATRDQLLSPGDRVEIYRPLLIDPKEARLKRAAKSTSE